jgi:cytochrome c oxidase subunit 1
VSSSGNVVGFFMVGGVMALLTRAELARPGPQFLSSEQNNQPRTG